MRLLVISIGSWIVAVIVSSLAFVPGQMWFLGTATFFSLPLLLTVPVIQMPATRLLTGWCENSAVRSLLSVAIGVACSLLAVFWPLQFGGDFFLDIIGGEAGAVGRFSVEVARPMWRPYLFMYGLFGGLVGLYLALGSKQNTSSS